MSDALVSNIVLFGRLLRDAGVSVTPDRLADAAQAFEWIDLGSRDEVYHTLRTLLVNRHEQMARFDRIFDAFWRAQPPFAQRRQEEGPPEDDAQAAARTSKMALALVGRDDDEAGELSAQGMWSDAGGVADKDFSAFTDDELRLARVALSRLIWTPGSRRTRRWIPGRGARIDLRRAIARSRRTGGELVTLPRRRRRIRPRTLVLLCDVSGSMERYSRMLLHFAHAIGTRHLRFEAFLFSTGLTRITTQLRTHRVDAAVNAVSRAVPDWSGGTRIGAALRTFHQRWGRTVLTGRPVVLLVSDGWDCGDPDLLRDEVARLHRSSHRLVWLNPLVGTAGYAPLTRGLQAALPYVDDFLPARTLRNLVDLADRLNALASGAGGAARRGSGVSESSH